MNCNSVAMEQGLRLYWLRSPFNGLIKIAENGPLYSNRVGPGRAAAGATENAGVENAARA